MSFSETRGGSRTVATSKVELFVIIFNGFQSSTLDVAAVLGLWKHFTASRLSGVSDAVTFLTSCSSSAISSSKSLIKTVSSDCKTSGMFFSRHSCPQSTCVGSHVDWGQEIAEKPIKKLDKCTDVKVEKCMKQPVKSVYSLKNFKITRFFYPKISMCSL